jgi:hypothetical protein
MANKEDKSDFESIDLDFTNDQEPPLIRIISDKVDTLTNSVLEIQKLALGNSLINISSVKSQEKRTKLLEICKDLSKNNIDPEIFDVLVSNELDRELKQKYGAVFLTLTVAFTIFSYGLVVMNSVRNWGIPQFAITALVIEIPIQFIGLLYIIARNLFPQRTVKALKNDIRPAPVRRRSTRTKIPKLT